MYIPLPITGVKSWDSRPIRVRGRKRSSGSFSRIFRSALKPVDVTSAVRALRKTTSRSIPATGLWPNHYTVRVAPSDMKNLQEMGLTSFFKVESPLATTRKKTTSHWWAHFRRIFETEEELTGQVEVQVETERWRGCARDQSGSSESNPIIDVEGEALVAHRTRHDSRT